MYFYTCISIFYRCRCISIYIGISIDVFLCIVFLNMFLTLFLRYLHMIDVTEFAGLL